MNRTNGPVQNGSGSDHGSEPNHGKPTYSHTDVLSDTHKPIDVVLRPRPQILTDMDPMTRNMHIDNTVPKGNHYPWHYLIGFQDL